MTDFWKVLKGDYMARKKSEKQAEQIAEHLEKESDKAVKEALKVKSDKKLAKGVENLIPTSERSKDEVRKIGRKGGKASGEARRKKKELRELTKSFLEQDAIGAVKANLQRLGFDADDMTNLAAILGVLFSKVLNNGDLNAARTIIEWAGMSPIQQIHENEAMARLQNLMGVGDEEDDSEDVIIYLPENERDVVDYVDEKDAGN